MIGKKFHKMWNRCKR